MAHARRLGPSEGNTTDPTDEVVSVGEIRAARTRGWLNDAACLRDDDGNPSHSAAAANMTVLTTMSTRVTEAQRRVCAPCPVRRACLIEDWDAGVTPGVKAGLAYSQRKNSSIDVILQAAEVL